MRGGERSLSKALDEGELTSRAASGDYRAFEDLVRLHHDRVYRLAWSMLGSASDAEEVVQDTFLQVFRSLPRFRGRSAFATWLYRIATNAALMKLRSRRRRPLVSVEDRPGAWEAGGTRWIEPPGVWSRTPAERLLDRELGAHIRAAIDKLPEQHRTVLLLRDVEGLSTQDVADVLGLTVPTVKTRLHRARLFLRDELERYFGRD